MACAAPMLLRSFWRKYFIRFLASLKFLLLFQFYYGSVNGKVWQLQNTISETFQKVVRSSKHKESPRLNKQGPATVSWALEWIPLIDYFIREPKSYASTIDERSVIFFPFADAVFRFRCLSHWYLCNLFFDQNKFTEYWILDQATKWAFAAIFATTPSIGHRLF